MGLISRLLGRKPAAGAVRAGTLEIRQPWARAAAGRPAEGACFFTVANTGPSGDRLVAASSPAAGQVEIHAIRVTGGDIAVRRLEGGLALPPHTAIELKPRGYHLLLLGLKAPLKKGASLPVSLVFEGAGVVELELPVRDEGSVGDDVLVVKDQPG